MQLYPMLISCRHFTLLCFAVFSSLSPTRFAVRAICSASGRWSVSSLARTLIIHYFFWLLSVDARHIIIFHLRYGWLTGTLTVCFLIRVVRFCNCAINTGDGGTTSNGRPFGWVIGWWIWLKLMPYLFNFDSTSSTCGYTQWSFSLDPRCEFISQLAIWFGLDRNEIYN